MKPDSEFDPSGFAASWWDHGWRHGAFEDHLLCAGDDGFDFGRTGTDHYDSSVEIYEVPPDARLNEAQQRLLADCGFVTAFVNHADGIETHYSLKAPPVVGWRRKRTDTGFIISYWPNGWDSGAALKWLETGYMTIDPNL